MAFPDASTALVTEKEGGMVRVELRSGVVEPIAGLPSDLDNRNRSGFSDNAGLFSVRVGPMFSHQPWVYFSYAARDPANSDLTTTKVARARLVDHRLHDTQVLLVATPYTADRYHYGGGLIFGPDGMLYVTVGERLFNEKDQPPMPIAQDYGDRRGKIYRLAPDGTFPDDNPDFPTGSPDGLYAVGIRASQGLAVDPLHGSIWFSEHGTRQGDEVNRLIAGANYGWPIETTGGYRDPSYQPPRLNRDFERPAWSWPTTVAPTGLTFYTGDRFPKWRGQLLVAGLSAGNLWRLAVDNQEITQANEMMTESRIRLRTIQQAPDGNLYVLTDEANGRLMRVEPVCCRE